MAAKKLGLKRIPVIRVSHLSETQLRAYALADNQLATRSGWDRELLSLEFGDLEFALPEIGLDLTMLGFDAGEIDSALNQISAMAALNPADEVPEIPTKAPRSPSLAMSLSWAAIRLLVGDARDSDAYKQLMQGEVAEMGIHDPPYNVRIQGNVGGRGRIKRREFACASGEMNQAQFTAFLKDTLGLCAHNSVDGAIHFVSPPLDHKGRPLRREHLQCKWHVVPGTYGYASLSDPEFINSASNSLLSRALAAQRAYAPDGEGARFRLVTNYRIDRTDPLRALVNQRSHALRLDNLFSGGDRSATGKVRKHWRDHLDIDDGALRTVARTLAFSEATDSLDDLRDTIDPYLRIAGLRRIPRSESAFIYDDLVYQWAGQGRLEFDRDSFHAACERESLFAGPGEEGRKVYGVKSFEHATDRLEDQCAAVLDLVPEFEARQIRLDSDWQTVLYPALRKFLLDAAKGTDALRLILDAHLTLSFAAGSILDIKSGRPIELIQRTIGKSIWSADDAPPDSNLAGMVFRHRRRWCRPTRHSSRSGADTQDWRRCGFLRESRFARREAVIGEAFDRTGSALSRLRPARL